MIEWRSLPVPAVTKRLRSTIEDFECWINEVTAGIVEWNVFGVLEGMRVMASGRAVTIEEAKVAVADAVEVLKAHDVAGRPPPGKGQIDRLVGHLIVDGVEYHE